MHACMINMLTTRLAPHDRLMCSQAAARQWSVHTMDINGYTSRGPLHSMVVHAVVQCQWLPSLCRMCRPRTITRSASLSVCSARVVRGRHLRLSRASRGFRERSSASETDSGCTIADEVAEGRLAAGFITILWSQQKFSFFRLSGAATHQNVRYTELCDSMQRARLSQQCH